MFLKRWLQERAAYRDREEKIERLFPEYYAEIQIQGAAYPGIWQWEIYRRDGGLVRGGDAASQLLAEDKARDSIRDHVELQVDRDDGVTKKSYHELRFMSDWE